MYRLCLPVSTGRNPDRAYTELKTTQLQPTRHDSERTLLVDCSDALTRSCTGCETLMEEHPSPPSPTAGSTHPTQCHVRREVTESTETRLAFRKAQRCQEEREFKQCCEKCPLDAGTGGVSTTLSGMCKSTGPGGAGDRTPAAGRAAVPEGSALRPHWAPPEEAEGTVRTRPILHCLPGCGHGTRQCWAFDASGNVRGCVLYTVA